MKYPQQLELRFTVPREATPEEAEQWFEDHLKPQAEASLKYVVYASLIQLGCLVFMLSTMALIDKIV